MSAQRDNKIQGNLKKSKNNLKFSKDSWFPKWLDEKLKHPTGLSYQYEDLHGELADMQEDGADFQNE